MHIERPGRDICPYHYGQGDGVDSRQLLEELNHPMVRKTPAYCDNDGVCLQAKNPINHNRAKHFRVSQAYIRMLNIENTIDTTTIDTKLNPADILTKALPDPSPLFIQHRIAAMGC